MYEIEVVDSMVNGVTGLIDVVVRAVDEGRKGPIRKYGIDATLLKVQYNSSIAEWLQQVKRDHQAHHGLHVIAVEELMAMKGKTI